MMTAGGEQRHEKFHRRVEYAHLMVESTLGDLEFLVRGVEFVRPLVSLAKARAVRMPESDDSMPTLMAAVFCFSLREAAPILLRRDMITAINTGRMHATTRASRHSMGEP